MGTNFYARRIPTQEEVAALHKLVDDVAAGVYSISSTGLSPTTVLLPIKFNYTINL